ncbi:hypothetical protein Htur_1207 [Haloterrigena turkmenica DSM 5511]|uniref:DUF7982 domain-containing protein n=1 Tax=Haloterrigena turkmenica (strain ATCC 51198 / DSM 5511 / JCM 9101 / NCIMB 13204 / VKM B-1734 / 4k) TaxID=543526 RepID=D2RP64_HALTV|nr:hypothetical protein [Haloterrigena turkmenica]ADB60098.1 hypothetical protein Htur_1207 [Haloterrigena turkmenica DSM 5511]
MSSNNIDTTESSASPAAASSAAGDADAETETVTDADAATEPTDGDDRRELAAQVELLADENRRLREEYVRARQSRYRATAIGLAAIGAVAVLGSVAFPDAREVLVALGATGLFGALLTYYLTPSRFVAADVGERVYTASTANVAAIGDELGLRDERVYLPGEAAPARLYVPQHADYSLPDERAGPIVVDDDSRGLLLEATGAELFRPFERALTGDLAADPTPLAAQLTDGLVEQFELARSAEADVDAGDGRATIAVSDSAFGPIDRFDHPIPSFLAVGFAAGLEEPVRLEIAPGDDRADWLVTCRWDLESDAEGDTAAAGDVETTADAETTAQ